MFARPLRAARMTKPRGRPSPSIGETRRTVSGLMGAAVRFARTVTASVSASIFDAGAVGANPTFANVSFGRGVDETAETTVAIPSLTLTANRLGLLSIVTVGNGAPSNVPTVAGWTLVRSLLSGGIQRVTVLRRMSGTTDTQGYTIAFGGQAQMFVRWSIDQSSANVKTTGTNGADAIVQIKDGFETGTLIGTYCLLTFDNAFSSSANSTFAMFGGSVSGSVPTAGSGFTELSRSGVEPFGNRALFTEYKAANDTTADMSWTTGYDIWNGIALEIAAATAPYTWFPAFDKNTVPFHVAAGAWGAQSTIKEAAAPQGTLVDVNVATAGEMATALYAGGRRITLTADISDVVFDGAHISDCDIIIPPGRVLSNCTFGSSFEQGPRNLNRIRIRGTTVGALSGGQLHSVNFVQWSGTGGDIIIDGVDVTGRAERVAVKTAGPGAIYRVAITNVRACSGGQFYIGEGSDVTFTNCSVLTGMDTAAQSTDVEEAWAIRLAHQTRANAVVYGCDLRSNPARISHTHARIRFHPDPGLDYVWINSNTFVERTENWIVGSTAEFGGGTGNALSAWVTGNTIVSSNTSGSNWGIWGDDQFHAYITDNTFQCASSAFVNDASITMTGKTATTKSGNTYAGLPVSDPAWGGPGDPSGLNWNI